jgi:hypothetical protein
VKLTKPLYIFLIFLPILCGCNLTKDIPQGKYLLKKNKITVKGATFSKETLYEVPRLRPNNSYLGMKIRLAAYLSVDSAHVAEKRIVKNKKLRQYNAKKAAQDEKKNRKRIKKAIKKGKTSYTQKISKLKDTLNPRQFFGEWLKYKIGEPAVLLDTELVNRSKEQLKLFLRKKGYYFSTITDTIVYKKKKASVYYTLQTGKPFTIDSIYYLSSNTELVKTIQHFVKVEKLTLIHNKFDEDLLDNFRTKVAKAMQDSSYYGFYKDNLSFLADTNCNTMTVELGIEIKPRVVHINEDSDSTINIDFATHKIAGVYFHISDTLKYKGNFSQKMEDLGLPVLNKYHFLQTLDTTFYERKDRFKNKSASYYLYNGKLIVKPHILELKNYLEHDEFYKNYYLERSYTQLLSMGVWQTIKPVLIENYKTNRVEVHYFLVPDKKQSYTFEPRATNSNGYLGVSASLSYINKNLFHRGDRLTISMTGGFESSPPIFDKGISNKKIKKATRSFNVFEFGPSIKLEMPGLFPFKATILSKRQAPTTEFGLAMYFQKRTDFTRNLFQFHYSWKWFVGKNQTFTVGFPFLSAVNYADLRKTNEFEQKLAKLNDLFLYNTYSDQLIFQDWKLTYVWSNIKLDKKNIFNYTANLDLAGNLLAWSTKKQAPDINGQKRVFGVPFSQFIRLDNEFKLYQHLNKKSSLNYHLQIGAGIPYGNSTTSLPFGYSFFAGGTNDNRGWRARELGPGAYQYYLDSNRTLTQVGDIRLGGTVEYRFDIASILKGALFLDAGNVWLVRNDNKRPGAQFTSQFINQMGIAGGIGFRIDLKFIIIRLDIGFPLRNPALPKASNWIFKSKNAYFEKLKDYYGNNYDQRDDLKNLLHPFTPRFHIGIGYPF